MARQTSIDSQTGENESYKKNRITADELPPAIRAKILAQQKKDIDERLKNGESPAKIAWENFEKQALEMHDNVAAEKYLDEYLDWCRADGKDLNEVYYELFTDFSTGRKKIKNDTLALKMVSYLKDIHDVNKLKVIVSFLEKKNHTYDNEVESIYMTLYHLFLHGENTNKDLNLAAQYLKAAINITNTSERQALLREIYEQQNSSLPEQQRVRKAYMQVIADKIDFAELEFAKYLKAHDQKEEALEHFIAGENFREAYDLVDIKDEEKIAQSIEAFKKGGADTEFAKSLNLMKSNFSLLKDLFSFTEQPLTYWGLSWRYAILGPVYAMFRTLHKNGALFFCALLGTIAAGVAGYFTNFGILGALASIILFLFLWMLSSLVSDVKRRQKFIAACELCTQISPHPEIEKMAGVFGNSDKIKTTSKKSGFLIFPIITYIFFAFAIFVIVNQEYELREQKAQAEQQIQLEKERLAQAERQAQLEKEKLAQAERQAQLEKEKSAQAERQAQLEKEKLAIDTLNAFHENITNKKYDRAYNFFSNNMKNRIEYANWIGGFETTVSSKASDIKIESKSENMITLSYTLTAVDNPGGTRKFDSTATLIDTDDGWKLESMNNKLKK